jgi:hypothetical protein
LRDKLLHIGATKLSAGVCTAVGGYARPQKELESAGNNGRDAVQFVIDDERSVAEVAADLERLGFQPVFADWLLPRDGRMPLAGALRRSLGGLVDMAENNASDGVRSGLSGIAQSGLPGSPGAA